MTLDREYQYISAIFYNCPSVLPLLFAFNWMKLKIGKNDKEMENIRIQ
jgi:hypothetical protein